MELTGLPTVDRYSGSLILRAGRECAIKQLRGALVFSETGLT